MSGIFDLGKLLTAAFSMDGADHIDKAFVRSIYDGTYYSEQTAGFEDVLYAASCLDLLDVDGSQIQLSDTGHGFVRLMSVRGNKIILDGNAAQKQFILGCLDTERVIDVCGAIFGKFQVDYAELPPVWCSRANVFDHREMYMLEIFEDAGIVHRERGLVIVDTCHTDIFSMMRNGVSVNFDAIHARKKQVGDVGEKLTMEYEMKRLAGHGDLADRVEQVSAIDPYAGYDVASFDGPQSGLCHDKFIEVKTTSSIQPRFFWSRNEICKARKYGDRYWIYLWTDIDCSKALRMIQNPYVELFETGKPKPEPTVYLVEKHVLDHTNIVMVEGDTT